MHLNLTSSAQSLEDQIKYIDTTITTSLPSSVIVTPARPLSPAMSFAASLVSDDEHYEMDVSTLKDPVDHSQATTSPIISLPASLPVDNPPRMAQGSHFSASRKFLLNRR